jgi:hypothetical protein
MISLSSSMADFWLWHFHARLCSHRLGTVYYLLFSVDHLCVKFHLKLRRRVSLPSSKEISVFMCLARVPDSVRCYSLSFSAEIGPTIIA